MPHLNILHVNPQTQEVGFWFVKGNGTVVGWTAAQFSALAPNLQTLTAAQQLTLQTAMQAKLDTLGVDAKVTVGPRTGGIGIAIS